MSEPSHALHAHHAHPISMYFKTFAALLVLMILTIAAVYVPHSPSPLWSFANNIIAMTIACVKAVLVILFFMGVKYSSNLTKMYAVAGFAWFTLLFVMYADYLTRPWEPVRGWEPLQPSALPRFPATNQIESTDIGKQQP